MSTIYGIRRLSLLACAAMLVATQANAQSTPTVGGVTLYGVIDACVVSYKSATGPGFQINGGGCAFGSRFGFRGAEDLGGGLKSYFVLEGGFNADSGTASQGGRMFGRRAIVGLAGNFGAVEAGREYSPTFYLLTTTDPMLLGTGSALGTLWSGSPSTAGGRTDNSINYQSPSFGSFSARLQFAPGEQAAPLATQGGNTTGASITYRGKELLAAVTYAKVANAADQGNDSATTIGGKYDFGKFSLAAIAQFGGWEGTRTVIAPASATSNFSRRYSSYLIGGTAKVGVGSVSATYKRYNDRTAANFDTDTWSASYTYPLSKRTHLYTGFTRLKNRGASSYGASDGNGNYTGVAPHGASRVVDIGITHFF